MSVADITVMRAAFADLNALYLMVYGQALPSGYGITGTYDFRDGSQRGLTEQNGIMVRWDAGRDTWVAISKFGGAPLR